MAQALPPLHWLRAYEAAARHASFSAAAQELNLTPAAVSHQIRSLERALGFRLFERLARRVELTEIGRAYLPSVRRAFDDLLVSTVGLFGAEQEAQLTVRAPVMLTSTWLAPRLAGFHRSYPNIRLRLLAGVWSEPSTTADVDIRFGDGDWPDFNVTLLLKDPSVVVARRDAVPPPGDERTRIEALMRGGVVHIMGCENRWVKLARQHDIPEAAIRVNMTADNSLFAIELTRAGLGPCLVQRTFAAALGGDLATPIADGVDIEEAHYVLTPRAAEKGNPTAMLFRKWLLDEAEAERPSLARRGRVRIAG